MSHTDTGQLLRVVPLPEVPDLEGLSLAGLRLAFKVRDFSQPTRIDVYSAGHRGAGGYAPVLVRRHMGLRGHPRWSKVDLRRARRI